MCVSLIDGHIDRTQNEMEKKLYELFCETEKKYYTYLTEKDKLLIAAKTNAEYIQIKDSIEGRFEFFARELVKNGVIVKGSIESEDGRE